METTDTTTGKDQGGTNPVWRRPYCDCIIVKKTFQLAAASSSWQKLAEARGSKQQAASNECAATTTTTATATGRRCNRPPGSGAEAGRSLGLAPGVAAAAVFLHSSSFTFFAASAATSHALPANPTLSPSRVPMPRRRRQPHSCHLHQTRAPLQH